LDGRRMGKEAGEGQGMHSKFPDAANVLKAAMFAAKKHQHQRRKDADKLPYINHLLAVASVLAVEAGVTDEALLVAALLHDTVEDTNTSFQELEETFGAEVRNIVEEVTDDKSLLKGERKQLQVDRAPRASEKAKQLKIADKICNVRDIATSPPAHWPLERKAEYLEWTRRVVRGCRGINLRLDEIYDETLAMARQSLGI
jgi:(p)ppGpp synthase/HD superfamily hydrolase